MNRDETFMERAIELALKGAGRTSPNPMVGAVVVRGGRIVGEGFHRRAGAPHAEINALKAAGSKARGADLYVTLEPCCNQGRTPPCTAAIARAGVRRVVAGAIDPNPAVRGKGIAQLKERKIAVKAGVLSEECRAINAAYNKLMESGLPFVTAKAAVTLDGKIAAADGISSSWISNSESRRLVHRMRASCDAVMIGIDTALVDDPRLTVRIPGKKERETRAVVADSSLKIRDGLKLLARVPGNLIVLTTEKASRVRARELAEMGHVIVETASKDGRVDMREALAALGGMGINSVLVEGGAGLISDMVARGLVDRMAIFVAPKFLGGGGKDLMSGLSIKGMDEAIGLCDVSIRALGDDVLIDGMVRRRCSQA
ncbi:MAG: bifunctional diaminohydroxyphosphoribosylaminopyrimidine deaminase/5-amino-6-(5-phosphoribosylamino)uracil reductase RibD [bacterium]